MKKKEQSIKHVAIVAGGDISDQFVREIREADIVIGADRGALWMVRHGIVPDVAVGDFDSVTQKEKGEIQRISKKCVEYPKKKDATDLELAIDEAIRHVSRAVYIYGALGGRFDHSIGALQMLLRLVSHNIYGEIVDNSQKINIVRHKQTFMKDDRYQYVSIFPFGCDTAKVSLSGFKYDLEQFVLFSDSSRGISNEILDAQAVLRVHKGSALVIRSND